MVGEWLVFLGTVVMVRGSLEGFIVGGALASIVRFPHSAFLSVACVDRDQGKTDWICGSSIINQRLVLTAGHCVYSCFLGTHIIIHLGDEYRTQGVIRSSHSFVLHEKYNTRTNANDIALVRLYMPLQLQQKISRVALLKNPPYDEVAMLAGWGLTNEDANTQGHRLKHIEQRVWPHRECVDRFGPIPKGTLCASSSLPNDYAAQGDSGSALVVRGYIQVGLVSYKVPTIANNVILYTDVGYFYDWIDINAKRLYCVASNK